MAAAREAAARAAAIAARLSGAPAPSAPAAAPPKAVLPPPLIVDASGKVVEDVMAIPMRRVTTLLANDPSRAGANKGAPTITSGIAAPARPAAPESALVAAARRNPYLAHHLPPPTSDASGGGGTSDGGVAAASTAAAASTGLQLAKGAGAAAAAAEAIAASAETVEGGGGFSGVKVHDPWQRRAMRARRGLQFHEPGAVVAEAEAAVAAAARAAEVAAFRTKGSRARPEFVGETGASAEDGTGAAATPVGGAAAAVAAAAAGSAVAAGPSVPAKNRAGWLPKATAARACAPVEMEWWDAVFMPAARVKEYETVVSGIRASAKAKPAGDGGGAADGDDNGDGSGEKPEERVPFAYAECELGNQRTWRLVQHPVPIVTAADTATAAIVVPLKLTPREAKRLRRLKRAERNKELVDKQRLGLLPPPEPKVRLANLHRVLKDASVADPSAMEAKVRAQVAQRVQNHELRNAAAKLTPEERRSKWEKKMTEHPAEGWEAALFRTPALVNKKVRFKVDSGAAGGFLVGVVLECRSGGYAMIYVEGGTRGIRRFVTLMCNRINWRAAAVSADEAEEREEAAAEAGSEDDDDDAGAGALDALGGAGARGGGVTARGFGTGAGSLCQLVWRGTTATRAFDAFRFEAARNVAAARDFMSGRRLRNMWNLVEESAVEAGVAANVVAPRPAPAPAAAAAAAAIAAGFAAGGFLQGRPPAAAAAAAAAT